MDAEETVDERKIDGCCQRNKLSICLALTTTCLTFVLVFFLIAFFGFVGFVGISETILDCTSPSCVKASVEISEFVDESVDPCEDFYGFVCGKFVKNAYENQINNPLKAEHDRIKHILDSFITEAPSQDDPQAVKMQKQYFRSCLNVDKIDADRDETLFKELDKIGGWPFLSRRVHWNEDDFNWKSVMIRARGLGLPFEWFLKVDLYDNDKKYTLKLSSPATCGSSRNEEYYTMRRDILESLRKPGIDTISELANLKDFEKKLDSLCAKMKNAPSVLKMVGSLRLDSNRGDPAFLEGITGLRRKWKVTSRVAYNNSFIYDLNHLLKGTPKKVQASYILWKIIEYFASYLSKPIRERYANYTKEISGEDTSRFQFCLEDTKAKFDFVSEVTYIKNHINSSVQKFGVELVISIKDELLSYIKNVQWRSNDTMKSYVEFYDNVEEIVGAPDEMLGDDYLTQYLHVGQLIFYSNNIIQIQTNWSQSVFSSQMKMIGETVTEYLGSAEAANRDLLIVLDEDEQQMILPAAAFHGFLYNSDLPQYFNYGGLGTMVGTELVKALHMLSTQEPYNGFEKNKKCVMKNFENTKDDLNASVVFNTNYDSWMGQALVYTAYQKIIENNDEETPLLNLPYSPNQLFWIKSSMNWCYHALPEEEGPLDLVLKYRIIETVKNSQSFAMDFGCPPDSPMNPKDKCQLF